LQENATRNSSGQLRQRTLAKPLSRNATVEVARDHLVHETPPEAVAPLEALLPRALDPVVEGVEETEQRRLPRIPRPVDPATDLHAQPEAGGRAAGGKGRPALALRPPEDT
jgi:hypothetical protein